MLPQMNENKVENPEIILHMVIGANSPFRTFIWSLRLLKEITSSSLVNLALNIFWPPDVIIYLHLGMSEKGSDGRAEISPFNTSKFKL